MTLVPYARVSGSDSDDHSSGNGWLGTKAHEKWDTAVADNDTRSGSCDQQSKYHENQDGKGLCPREEHEKAPRRTHRPRRKITDVEQIDTSRPQKE